MTDKLRLSSEEDYAGLFQILRYGILRYDGAGRLRDANPAAYRILGLSPGDLHARPAWDIDWKLIDVDGNDLEPKDWPLMRSIKIGQPIHDYQIGVFNPELRRHIWLRGDVVPQADINSRELQYWIIFHDVTKEFEADAELRESRSNLDLAQRVASVGSSVFSFRKRTWYWSAELVSLFGISEVESRAAGPDAFAILVDVQDREAYLHGLEIGGRGIVPYPLEFRLHRSDKSSRIVYREAELIRDERGLAGIIFTHKDITEAREAENQKQALQQQLFHAQRLDALGTLASGIAHDINNTLVPIIGLTQSILSSPTTEPSLKPLLELIERGGTRARDLVRRIVDFSRKDIPKKSVFDLAAVVNETLKLVRATVSPSIELEHDIANVGNFEGDATQMHQLLINLIANAVHAIDEGDRQGKGKIIVSLRQRKSESVLELRVADDGVGMDPDTQKRIFEPFFTTKSVGEGTGLGLSIVHGIVRAHGGTISVKSSRQRGSIFAIRLPKYKAIEHDENSCH